ncbi:MAG: hypothetical protein EOO88_31570 [Pedobacter sp.]|nr:MAG: hypothetical protein EOO88_31570 [Pedobacter sp.]
MNKILEHTHNDQRWLFVPIHSKSQGHYILSYTIIAYDLIDSDENCGVERVPQGDWQIVSKLSDITEEQAREMVPRIDDGLFIQGAAYPDYLDDDQFYETTIESLHSLIRSKGGDTNNEYLVLKEG